MLKKKIKNIIKKMITKRYIKKIFRKKNIQHIILIGSPIHGNLGDQAISIAEKKMFENISNYEFIEIPGSYYNIMENEMGNYVHSKDIILITGGGFIGTLWPDEQDMVNSIIENFPNNRIIILPQTFYFSNDDIGKKELNKMQKLVKKHHDIHIFTREKRSYDFCMEHFEFANTIDLVPDMVLSFNFMKSIVHRSDVLLCFRSDKEKTISDLDLNNLYDDLKTYNLIIKRTDTVINHGISLRKRNNYFVEKLLEFQQCKLVITDRLHGMLFAAITGTPCIAVDNSSHKVKGVYEWLKSLEYIVFIDKIDKVNSIIEKLLEFKEVKYDLNIKYKNYFNKIKKLIY